MYSRILVAVDESDASTRALAEALRLAREQHALVNMVYVIDTWSLYWASDQFFHAYRCEQACRARGRALLQWSRRRALDAGVQVETTLFTPEGESVSAALVEVGKRWRADVIVAGTHGRRGLSRLLLGSVAETVGRLSPVSVLVVGREGRKELARRAGGH